MQKHGGTIFPSLVFPHSVKELASVQLCRPETWDLSFTRPWSSPTLSYSSLSFVNLTPIYLSISSTSLCSCRPHGSPSNCCFALDYLRVSAFPHFLPAPPLLAFTLPPLYSALHISAKTVLNNTNLNITQP